MITSPPYWGLRDYGNEPVAWGPECEHEWGGDIISKTNDSNRGEMEWTTGGAPGAKVKGERVSQGSFCCHCSAWRGNLGLEPTPELYVEHLVEVMREVRRVLQDDGTLWLNLGDSYSGSGRGPSSMNAAQEMWNATVPVGLKPKDLVGIPWRVAFALQADGWWLRSDIVWSKPNPMPESVTDRPTRSHEYLFLLTKKVRYYYDADAIREPAKMESEARYGRNSSYNGSKPYAMKQGPTGRKTDKQRGHSRRHAGFNDRWDAMSREEQQAGGANKRSVWEIATQPYPGAHFAVFPEKLVEPCILAGCPEGGTVLDPFAGSGTVGLVAERLGRHSILIDASEDYCRMARERTAQMGLMI
ncbi:MAG: site-specific DNA-methyltransferase [Candidatus Tectomicrobia bacterium]